MDPAAYYPGDIVLLDFPFTNRQGSKYRPAIILAPGDYPGDHVVAYVTSNADLSLSLPHCIGFGNEDLQAGRMAEASAVRVDKVITVSSKTISKEPVARLNDAKLREVLKCWTGLSARTFSRTFHTANRPGDDALRPAFVASEGAVPYAGRVFTEDEVEAAVSATLDFWLTLGPEGEAFEKELAQLLGVKHSLLVNSGSSANLVALSALTTHKLPEHKRIRPGDEIITVAAGFPTTVAPILQNGAVAVFIDNNPETGNAWVESLEAAYTPGKTKAVMMAHALGNPFDVGAVLEFCHKHDLWLIEDNCDALGCTYSMPVERAKALGLDHLLKIAEKGEHAMVRLENGGRTLTAPTGTWGDISTQSFYPPHHLTMGEGGAVSIIRRAPLKTYAESFRDWGRDCWCPSGKDNTCGKRFGWKLGELPEGYDHKYIYSHLGYNLKPLDPQAAIGRQQLKRLPAFIEARKHNWETLRRGLADLEEFFEFSLPTHATGWSPPASGFSSPVSAFFWDGTQCRTDCSWFGFMLRVRPGSPFTHSQLGRHLDEKRIGNRMLFGGNLLRQPVFVQLRKDNPAAIRVVGRDGKSVGELSSESIAQAVPGADEIMGTALFLGTYPGLSSGQLEYEIETIRDFVAGRQ
jgi:CDP-6-deoxy-D-xylo-4-hexulose-3-dehydrase